MALDADQLNDLRHDAGLSDDVDKEDGERVFSDAELQRIWTRTDGAATDEDHHFATLGLIFMQLMNNANKLHRYSLLATSESLEQVRAHLKDSFLLYKPYLDAANGTRRRQFVPAELNSIPRDQEEPYS
jgi:hypothetical protein